MQYSAVTTKIVGILNVTPNSFSDGGKFLEANAAIRHATDLIEHGAAVIDVGAESTAPGVSPITQEEEWSRLKEVLPEIIRIAHNAHVEVSIDTRNAKTAELALKLGVDYINDQGGLLDPDMPAIAAASSAKIIIMHHFGLPVSRDRSYVGQPEQLLNEIIEWLCSRVDTLIAQGVARERIILDPGLGFGKLPEYSWYIAKNIGRLKKLGFPVCVGHSRKSMFSLIPVELSERDVPTAMLSTFLAQQQVDFLRVHDVKLTGISIKIANLLA
ncbi:dihydropteroate synthase [Anaplasma phagocytophilum]|uniref:dihydropteroate synthase n=1 Tax=Anaplasma phagocytophilum TaxID=948 RepID=UPI0007E0D00C|nr:dihydropteroate synthase [Anaplasma phagocytophilum]SBO30289.1 Dihydropteroate synthase [Anaplasma phagocytophilum]SBO30328.1 Dihydropteroate synthase [Anaplasma phagocytophilum]SBO30747.1 Dihydropteroate synthase [Anaplasma phagocytophilum]SCV61933.1 Dihydropteroate synthase [Anaplasma phagocytophilum]